MRKYFFLLFFLSLGVSFQPLHAQKKDKRSGLVNRGNHGDPFTKKPKVPRIVHFFKQGALGGGNQVRARSQAKNFSLSARQRQNQNLHRGAMSARGVKKSYNVAGDAFHFRKKGGKRGRGSGNFYKKKHGGAFKIGRGKHESRRMDKSNRSFKKK